MSTSKKCREIAELLALPPFSRRVDLETLDPGGLLQLLNDVLAEVDPTTKAKVAEAGVEKMVAILGVLEVAAPEEPERRSFVERLRRAEPSLVISLLHWVLGGLRAHKKRVYDARFALPVTVLAQHASSSGAYARVANCLSEVPRERFAEQVMEVGLPEAWDASRLVDLVRLDSTEAGNKPWLTVAQRWKVSARWLANKAMRKVVLPPKNCLHATEPGALNPQILWTHPRFITDRVFVDVAPFCFPDGVQLEERRDDEAIETFAFHVAPSSQSKKLYGACCVDRRATALDDGGSVATIPRCFCLLSKIPCIDLHCRVLESVVRHAKTMIDPTEAKVRDVVRSLLIDYAALSVPAPGSEIRFAIVPGAAEKTVFRRPPAHRYADLLDEVRCKMTTVPPAMSWTLPEYAALDATADWSVPLLLAALPARQLVRVVAAVLCELQVVLLSSACSLGAAACLSLATLARPLLWVGPLVPVLPTQLHNILEAPTPYIVATPRSPTWLACVTNRLPRPGMLVLDLDAASLCFHPTDSDLLDLPDADALVEALQPILAALHATPNHHKAARLAQREVARHVSRLCQIATRFFFFEKKNNNKNNKANHHHLHGGAVTRTRESLEFAALLRQELGDDPAVDARRPVDSAQALRESIDHTFLDLSASQDWMQRPSTRGALRRRVFFERLASSQSFAVFRDTFPNFPEEEAEAEDSSSVDTYAGLEA
ncbi:hypothetical protein CTAYLR_006172 [Chrysophaeum taylorii]|uniref:UDENN domain-containing protein n=1 Tax=Chrysophaeum taylorii TaxID=2483200 RepID=A0AAD7UND9_9STRA|nr:hypothetical protein CTAYLR_006172 [Chrysophaeum taylorii]